MNKGQLAEEYTNYLAYKSYLKYWCYPNPIDEDGDKKEICDLLILFRTTCIIISVKNYEFNGNYQRYIRKVVEKSTKQLYGAERKLFHLDREVAIKHPNRDKEIFDPNQYDEIYRITVNMGEQFEYYSLADQQGNKGFINILNKETFENILQELDTIPDIVEYLKAREKLLTHYHEVYLNGKESDIIAVFMLNKRSFPDNFFKNTKGIELELNGAWENYYYKNLHVKDRKEADQLSYLIDKLVERDILNESWGESLGKELMSFNRLNRRIIAQNFYELIEKYADQPEIIARRHIQFNEVTILLIKYPNKMQIEEKERLIEDAVNIYFYKLNIQNKLIVLGAPPDLSESKYGIVVKAGETNEEGKEYLEWLCDKYGWFQSMKRTAVEYKEFPNEK